MRDQFTVIKPGYFLRHRVCDMFPYCFRPAHTVVYADDSAGLETPVLCLCSFHSGTLDTELLPFEKLNQDMVKLAVYSLAKEQEKFNLDDVIHKLIELGYHRQVHWADWSEVIELMSFVLVSVSMANHYVSSWGD